MVLVCGLSTALSTAFVNDDTARPRNRSRDIVEIYNSSIPGRLATADTEPVGVESRREWFDRHDTAHYPPFSIRARAHSWLAQL